jgi:hypothetical protein
MNQHTPHRPPPYRLFVVMIAGLVVALAAQLVYQLPRAMAAAQTTAERR